MKGSSKTTCIRPVSLKVFKENACDLLFILLSLDSNIEPDDLINNESVFKQEFKFLNSQLNLT